MVGRHCGTRFAALLLALCFALFLNAPSVWADDAKPMRGVALVIGESRYEHLTALPNPANDARAVDRLLGELGFDVTSVTDGDKTRLDRGLQRFVEDAAGADVALLYYSGHGIEAGGENYLVPVGADPSSLADAGKNLVPLSGLLAELKAKVPVAIVLLDACRTNPFPAGATIVTASGPAPVAAAGLDLTRGAAPLADAADAPQSLGEVIGFAAEPGHAALDGDAGGNSPYAAALLKHLAAGGFAFGDVMTMVAEEVYVQTGGRQRPWTNASLRRLLYFGLSPEQAAGDDAAIRGEHRKLLLTIATTPADTRRLVEAAANSEAVPLGTLYGLLAALGTDVPSDPRELDRLLRGQTEHLKTIIAERQALKSTDVDIVRLSDLAEKALADGAVTAAIQFQQQAKARVARLSKTVDRAEADVKARRIEFAEVYSRSGDTYFLAFQQMKAADDYRKAFEQVKKWDAGLAWHYKLAEANAIRAYGTFRGDNKALQASMRTFAEAAKLLPQDRLTPQLIMTQNDFGLAMYMYGQRQSDSSSLEQAVGIFSGIVSSGIKQVDPSLWAEAQSNLGTALVMLGTRKSGPEQYQQAATAFAAARQAISRQEQPVKWALARKGEADAIAWTGLRGNQPDRLHEAVDAYEDVLKTLTRDLDPLSWAAAQDGLGSALWAIGDRLDGSDLLQQAVDAYNAALRENTRERVPLLWATEQNNLANAMLSIGQREQGTRSLALAANAYRNALEEWTREREPFSWATAHNNLARALVLTGERTGEDATIRAGLASYDEALKEWTKESAPLQWASLQGGVGAGLLVLGRKNGDARLLGDARQRMQLAWSFYHDAGYPQYDGYFQGQMAEIDKALAALK
ncbi:caspase family protein [Mesorhizobium qingshengii]|uniref:Caspase family protein n=1 Tax=Mesorhizobium qingshengii TaxID=1165689 RepID=A0ABT4QTI4_9HYPH|nr:caspase family protein [Mesorhizobium qingshengii]MCZ8544708.1 caspase family protein [Mesorhizobium qingshengii]